MKGKKNRSGSPKSPIEGKATEKKSDSSSPESPVKGKATEKKVFSLQTVLLGVIVAALAQFFLVASPVYLNKAGEGRTKILLKQFSEKIASDKSNINTFTSASCRGYEATSTWAPTTTSTSGSHGNPFDITVYAEKDHVSDHIQEHGSWQLENLEAIKNDFVEYSRAHNLTLNDLTVIDVGAGVGWFTLSMAALGVNVIAFERSQERINMIQSSMCLPSNLKSGVSDRITLFRHGLGAADLTCTDDYWDEKIKAYRRKCATTQVEGDMNFETKYDVKTQTPIKRLDGIFDMSTNSIKDMNIVMLKIDVGGAEYSVVRGAKRLLAESQIPMIEMEFVPLRILEKEQITESPQLLMQTMIDSGYRAESRFTDDSFVYLHKAQMINYSFASLKYMAPITFHSTKMREIKKRNL